MWTDISSDFRLLHIVKNAAVNPAAYEHFLTDFRRSFRVAENDRLSENYGPQEFDIANHRMFDALYDQKGNFVACAGIYRRESWPAGVYRLLNRTFYSPAFRRPERFQFFGSDYILPYQLAACSTAMDLVFVSREGPFAHNTLAQINLRRAFNSAYRVSEDFIQVVPGVFNRSAFQKILYKKRNSAQRFTFTAAASLEDVTAGRTRLIEL